MSQRSVSRASGKVHWTLKSPGELRAAAGHVRYELDMLVCAAHYIPVGISSPAVDETKNIALKAFLLHYRNLRAFLRLDQEEVHAGILRVQGGELCAQLVA
jgi:hypothetical protein